jgi:hypothetical protein
MTAEPADHVSGDVIATVERSVDGRSRHEAPPNPAPPGRTAARTFLTVVGVITVIYVATFVRGLWWQWKGILLAQPASPPVVTDAPRGAEPRAGVSSANAGQSPDPLRKPLPRSETPAPRNTTDERGVSYDADGVAVMGIDADPSGVYNVPAGRQVRIGGPAGALYDVGDGGKLTPAVKR